MHTSKCCDTWHGRNASCLAKHTKCTNASVEMRVPGGSQSFQAVPRVAIENLLLMPYTSIPPVADDAPCGTDGPVNHRISSQAHQNQVGSQSMTVRQDFRLGSQLAIWSDSPPESDAFTCVCGERCVCSVEIAQILSFSRVRSGLLWDAPPLAQASWQCSPHPRANGLAQAFRKR